MADLENFEAMEPDVPVTPELDQPDQDAVSLTDLLDAGDMEAAPGEQENGEEQAENATPQPEAKPQEKTLTQADFNRVFAERSAELRRQFEREHEDDLSLARFVREYFPGKTVDEIDEALISAEASQLSAKTGWSVEEAIEKVRARHEYMRRGSAEYVDPQRLQTLQRQLETINREKNIDFLEIIKNDPYLAQQVDSGKMDIKDAYTYYLEQKLAQNQQAPKRRVPPPVERSATASGIPNTTEIPDSLYHKINDMLSRGQKVRL
jgi:hypothetical protein